MPFLDKNRPEDLLCYIEDVEKELSRVGVVDGQKKKDWLRYYADQHTSDEWTVLDADTTVERLCLNLRFSHSFISVQNIILASLNHTSIGTVSVNGYL